MPAATLRSILMMLGRSRNNKLPGNVASSSETNGWKYPTVAVTGLIPM